MLGFLTIAAFQLLGIALHEAGVPLPGSVLGLLLLTLALRIGLVKVEWVERAAAFLVRHMMLLFIPLMVSLTQISSDLRRDGVALLVSLAASLLAVILTTGGLAKVLLRAPNMMDDSAADSQ